MKLDLKFCPYLVNVVGVINFSLYFIFLLSLQVTLMSMLYRLGLGD